MGLVAIGAASAVIAFAPNVLFPPANEPNLQLTAPSASREVARVSAAVPPIRHGGSSGGAGQPSPTSGAPVAGGAIAVASTGGDVRTVTAGSKAGRQVFRSGGGGKGSEGSPTITSKSHGKGKAKGHFKGKSHGKAKGHSKKKHHD
jgi:hypothetical protein